ncbi:DUF502 domain-containing protein [Salinibaculum salinum]|uniref:DUF502 domain-containing protein n=1 Tax=Salinibaculum salinum TaxID=3131996 RepID=UPI0030ED1474
MGSWKRDFASGLIILTPLLITLFVVVWIFNQLAGLPVPVDDVYARVALTLAVFVLLVFAIGYLMRTAVGAVFESTLDSLINRLPGLRVVYNASKMAAETALGGTENLQAPVKIETWDGMRMTAFKTGQKTDDGRDLLFLPTAPNITTGYVIEVEPDEYTETDESLEDALTRVLSAGFGENNETGLSQLLDGQDRLASGETDAEQQVSTDDAEGVATSENGDTSRSDGDDTHQSEPSG